MKQVYNNMSDLLNQAKKEKYSSTKIVGILIFGNNAIDWDVVTPL